MSTTRKSTTDKPEPDKPKPKRGPPMGSQNHFRHGLRAGKLPREMGYIENAINSLRRQLETAVVECKGAVNIPDASLIDSAAKWERHGRIALHYLRRKGSELTPADCLRFSEAIAKASDARDKAIRLLQLDRDTPAPWLTLPALTHNEPEPTQDHNGEQQQ